MICVAVWIKFGSKNRLFESKLLVTPILKPCYMWAKDEHK